MPEPTEIAFGDDRRFPPDAVLAATAHANDPGIYAKAAADPDGWWAEWADRLRWSHPYATVRSGEVPDVRWFDGGRLNASDVCVDRWAEETPGKRAIVWEGETGEVREISYRELRDEVARIAGALRELGIRKGDRVAIYLPMVPELPMTMLACARIGAVHTVVFGGFSADALAERANDSGAKLIVTADGGWRRGKTVELLKIAREAVALGTPTVEKTLVLDRMGSRPVLLGNEVAWGDLVARQSTELAPEPMESEDPLFILYTSGSTGKPKGILHTTAGYLTGVTATSKLIFDLKPEDLYFCTADCGWITGHSYLVYGPLGNGASVLMYEGAPDWPERDRFWRIIEKHRATILYTAPTAIRSFMKWGRELPDACDLTSLRLLGSVGEPINPEAWMWYRDVIGGGRCPVVDTWWQTETGAIMISPLPGLTTLKPGSATKPFPGVSVRVVGEDEVAGHSVASGSLEGSGTQAAESPATRGFLTIDRPWPSMLRGIWGDPERYRKTYWDRFPGLYLAGDGVQVDADGDHWLLGRIDDIMLVAGHNVSTMEVESALVSHPAVAEAAVIGRSHEIKGQAIAAFVILRGGGEASEDDLKKHVAAKLGPICRPDDVFLVGEVPKTRSGKIMRRLLRDIAEGRAIGDTTTLADPAILAGLKEKYETAEG